MFLDPRGFFDKTNLFPKTNLSLYGPRGFLINTDKRPISNCSPNNYLGDKMTVFAILANLSTLLGLAHSVEALVQGVVQKKQAPSLAELLPLLDQVEKIFKSGAIKIDGVNDEAIAEAIQLVRDQLSKASAELAAIPAEAQALAATVTAPAA
jgi:hypothetical protein